MVSEGLTLDEAFEVLIRNLDPPTDPHREMLKLCRSDWKPGQQIDDFFYEIKGAASKAKAPLSIVALILVSQLPVPLQHKVNEWIRDNPVEDQRSARSFITKIRTKIRSISRARDSIGQGK